MHLCDSLQILDKKARLLLKYTLSSCYKALDTFKKWAFMLRKLNCMYSIFSFMVIKVV